MLKRIRLHFSLTQKELAYKCGISVQTLRRYEKGTAGRLSHSIEDVIIQYNLFQNKPPFLEDWNEFLKPEILKLENDYGITVEVPKHRPLSENYEHWKSLCLMLVGELGLGRLPEIGPVEDHMRFRYRFMENVKDAGYKFDTQTDIYSLKAYSEVVKVHTYTLLEFEEIQASLSKKDRKIFGLPVELYRALKEIYPDAEERLR